ncbi:hypothetical protein [Lentilactobacillus otakiensis]|uniref:hypothetical protein n=1 Tax=Lentilactobacillus otakiensis TaxID=481720 RepID=UPI00058671CA|nr:hypothetical protein [Lentilactobacillus otakiensis]MBZ3777561.1 hypothetical protein [Lentilactobacillus otakiensis]MDV3517457.1 hypothetical protein [Lentilactobacillus otakiensis]
MNKPVYVLRIALQAIIIAGIYFLYCSNPDGSFTLRIGLVLAWLILSFASQFYLMKFRGLYPISQAVADAKGKTVGEMNFFLAVGLLLAYDLLGPVIAIVFYYWDKRLVQRSN